MILNNIKAIRKNRGFTIVELLVVIVVIGILASITIVSYTGVTAKANTVSAQAAANSAIKKLEAYNADVSGGGYPATFSLLTGATADKVYAITGVTFATAAITAAPTVTSTVAYHKCGTAGVAVAYWNYGTSAVNYYQSGAVTGGNSTTLGTNCTTTAVSS